MPGDDAVPVFFRERDEVFDGLEAGAFGAVAPAAQVLGGVAGVLVVKGKGLVEGRFGGGYYGPQLPTDHPSWNPTSRRRTARRGQAIWDVDPDTAGGN